MEQYFRVGVITSPHGVRGEMKVYPTTDDVSRFKKGMQVILDTKKAQVPHQVENVKFFKNMVILKLDGINSMNDAELLRQCDLLVTRENAVPLEEGEYYLADLLDMTVEEEDGSVLGTLVDVLETGANSVYVVRMESGKEVLLPNIPDCIRAVDVENGRMTVHVMEGLLDI